MFLHGFLLSEGFVTVCHEAHSGHEWSRRVASNELFASTTSHIDCICRVSSCREQWQCESSRTTCERKFSHIEDIAFDSFMKLQLRVGGAACQAEGRWRCL